MYAFLLFSSPLMYYLLSRMNHLNLPPIFRDRLPAIIWPGAWEIQLESFELMESKSAEKTESKLFAQKVVSPHIRCRQTFSPDNLLSQLTHHFSIAMTFGLCSPPLALAIILVVWESGAIWRILINRFLLLRFERLRRSVTSLRELAERDPFVLRLEESLIGVSSAFEGSIFPILFIGTVFHSCLVWDIGSDHLGINALWFPFSLMGLFSALYILYKFRMMRQEQRNPLSTMKCSEGEKLSESL
jgi:hypothetical protein